MDEATAPGFDAEETRAPRVLIVDDEPYIRELIQRCLELEGYECRLAPSAEAALDALGDERFELMVSDIHMPGMSGMELLATVRQRHPELAVLMVTGVDDRKVGIQALRLGAYGYLIKPFDVNELAINAANALQRRQLALLSQATQERLEGEVRRRTTQIRRREEEIALRLVAAAEFRDTDTGAHVRRIGLYAAALSQMLGWPAARVDDLRVAAMMHDIGKIGVPDSILLKPGPLLPDEFEIIKQHTVIGARILERSEIGLIDMAREIALSHHERWDGGGYPLGLAGESIPEAARIVAVCDVYDALVHDRIYRPAIPEREVLELLVAQRGRHFDAQMLDPFLAEVATFRAIREEVQAAVVSL
ncbi:MAG TPA: HD domain-containing phosphohydrolase [Thermoanaerobaculia bacterium]|jgi:putative two-component system response regulator|nr:HD domain-containing phosphohydrolase [Thermoanaerobaculia bacterium]